MRHLLQPIFAAIIGAAVSLFALLQAVRLWPAPAVWRQAADAAPALVSVGICLACIGTTVLGIAMAATAVRSARRRFAQLRHLRLHSPDDIPEAWG